MLTTDADILEPMLSVIMFEALLLHKRLMMVQGTEGNDIKDDFEEPE